MKILFVHWSNPRRWVTFVSCQTYMLRTVCKQMIQQSEDVWERQQTTSCFPGFISHLGRMIFSLGSSEAKSLKVLNFTEGGWRKGLAPKLNSHCWYDIKLAAAKKPDLTRNRGKAKKLVHLSINGGREERGWEDGQGKGKDRKRMKRLTSDTRGGWLCVWTYVAEEKTCFSGGSWCPFR